MVQSFSRVDSQEHAACVRQAVETTQATLTRSRLWLRHQAVLIPAMQYLEEWEIPEESAGVLSVPQHVARLDTTLITAANTPVHIDKSFASFTPHQFANAQRLYADEGFERLDGNYGLHNVAQEMEKERVACWRVRPFLGDAALASLAFGAPDYPREGQFARFNLRPLITLRHEIDLAGNCLPIGPGSIVSALVQYDKTVNNPVMFLSSHAEAQAVPERWQLYGAFIGAALAQEASHNSGQAPTPGDQTLIAVDQRRREINALRQGDPYYPDERITA